MAEKPNKTEQGRQKRAAEKAARAAATQGRRDSAAAAQSRSEQRKGRNVDEGSASRDASFAAREAAAGLYLAGNDTISAGRGGPGPSFAQREAANGLTNTTLGRAASRATNPDFPPVGTALGNDEFVATNNIGGGGGGLPETPNSEGLYALVNQVTIVDGQPTGEISWQKTESC